MTIQRSLIVNIAATFIGYDKQLSFGQFMLIKDFPRIDASYEVFEDLLRRYETLFPQHRPAEEKKYMEEELRQRDQRVKKWLNRLSREQPSVGVEDLRGKIADPASIQAIMQNHTNHKLQFQIGRK